MKIFIDSADINEIKSLNDTGLIDGVTTNPSLIAKSGLNFIDAIVITQLLLMILIISIDF